MKTTNAPRTLGRTCAALLFAGLLVAALPAPEAEASGFHVGGSGHRHHGHHHGTVGVGFNSGAKYWVDGYYAYQTQTVLVTPAGYRNVWVEPVYQTRVNHYGRRVTVLVQQGYWQQVYTPAQYETRKVKVWVPGYYAYGTRPGVSLGFNFKF